MSSIIDKQKLRSVREILTNVLAESEMRTLTSLSRLSDNCEAYYPFRGSASSFCITFDSVLFKQMNFSECDNKISSLKTTNIGCFLKNKVSSRYFPAVSGKCKAVHVSVTWCFPLLFFFINEKLQFNISVFYYILRKCVTAGFQFYLWRSPLSVKVSGLLSLFCHPHSAIRGVCFAVATL